MAASLQRVFLALWPTAPVLARLRTAAPMHVSGRHMRADTLHMTLAFIGEVNETDCADIISAVGRVQAPAFTLRLDALGYWANNHILWAGTSRTPEVLSKLAADLRGTLDGIGIPYDRKAFTPHVTLMRNASAVVAERLQDPIEWPIREWRLVRSRPRSIGPHYETLARWPCEG
ncbi:MAG: RNA 2',3'-cyclic phosphodiesterase [Rhodocyclaceae bacterium]